MFNVEPEPENSYFLGLDLGQAKDFTALAIMSRFGETNDDFRFDCVYLRRWPLRTSYPAIVSDVIQIVARLPRRRTNPVLAVDNTGVGAPVTDLFRREPLAADLKAIQIVGGSTVSYEGDVTRVPKRDLVSTVQVALQNRTLKIADQLPDAATLTGELQNFQVKITDSANDTYGAWREGTHDDLVLAAALALWVASRPVFVVTEQERDLFEFISNKRF